MSLSPKTSESFKRESKVAISRIWVLLINEGYHKVYVDEVGLLYRDWRFGKSKKIPIRKEGEARGIGIDPGQKLVLLTSSKSIESCPREISGAYAMDETGKVWCVRKKLKVQE